MITTRGQQPAGGSSSEQQPSPSGALTPHQPLSSLPSTSHDSPLNLDSPREDTGKKRVVGTYYLLKLANRHLSGIGIVEIRDRNEFYI